jgi:outer membrane immunogenic protein
MRRFLLASTTLITLVTGFNSIATTSSWAADFAPPVVIASRWTGCFIGVHGGGGTQSDSQTTMSGVGVFGGGQVGCNYQIHDFVVGVEAEGAWSNIRTRNDTIILAPGGMSSKATETNKSFYDVTMRLGYTFFDRTLLYAKIGMAWSNQFYDRVTTNPSTTTTASWMTPGLLIGEGFEYQITPQWIARVEMDMLFFDATNVTFATTGGPSAFIQTVTSRNVIGKVGVSYKFF